MIFQWDETSIWHIAEHGVSPSEAEYVVRNAEPPFPENRGGGKLLVWGPTDTAEMLQVVFVHLPDEEVDIRRMSAADRAAFVDGDPVFYVIHAMPLDEKRKRRLKNRYKKKGRR
jgi:hypothetical protein